MASFGRFFLGGIVGAAVGILLAPKSGKELRQQLLGGGQDTLPEDDKTSAPPPVALPVDLESRIEETRQQVEAELDSAIAAPPVEEAPAAEEAALEAEEAEAATEEAPVSEAVAEPEVAEEAAEEPKEEPGEKPEAEEVPAEEPEPVEEPVAGVEAAEETAAAESEQTPADEAQGEAETEPPLASPEAAQLDRDEMRKRIEETRARLKAKAFDTMVDGETFLATDETPGGNGGSGEDPGPDIDSEAGEQIDNLLEEED